MKNALLICTWVIFSAIAARIAPAQDIQIDGSSTVFPISEAVSERFQKVKQRVIKISVRISGTGGGFKKFCRGETDINDASRPILKEEMQSCKKSNVQYFELPVAYDALTVMVNPRNDWVQSLTVADLKKIWEPAAHGKLMKWNQIRSDWPNNPLKLFGPGVDSGTFDYFTEAIIGKAKHSRADFTASEDDNILVEGIANDQNALGYFGYAYYIENQKKLKAVPIDGGKGPIMPSAKSVEDGTYQRLSRPIFIYVSKKSLDRPIVREYVEFYLRNAVQWVKQVKYMPLPPTAYAIGLEHIKKGKIGTAFAGEPEVNIKINDLLKREGKL